MMNYSCQSLLISQSVNTWPPPSGHPLGGVAANLLYGLECVLLRVGRQPYTPLAARCVGVGEDAAGRPQREPAGKGLGTSG